MLNYEVNLHISELRVLGWISWEPDFGWGRAGILLGNTSEVGTCGIMRRDNHVQKRSNADQMEHWPVPWKTLELDS
jgi:hypothetical protein